MKLAIGDTSNKAFDIRKDKALILSKLNPVFRVELFCRKLDATELSLDDDGPLMRRQSDIDIYWKLYPVAGVEEFEERFLSAAKSDFM